jgi:DNA-directed RNA polymerase specialized sigma24 family protein
MSNQSFEEFYRKEYAAAARLCYLLLGSQLTSEDIVQESFMAIEPRFGELTNPAAYLRATIVNRTASWHRKVSRRGRLAARLYHDKIVGPQGAELFDVIALLSHQQRTALTLRYWSDLSNAEIATVMNCREGTVKSLISRGLTRLRHELKEML